MWQTASAIVQPLSRRKKMPLPPVGGSGLSSKALASTGRDKYTLPETNINRTAVYNDGYNLFNAIYDIGWFDAIWVNLELFG